MLSLYDLAGAYLLVQQQQQHVCLLTGQARLIRARQDEMSQTRMVCGAMSIAHCLTQAEP